MTVNYCLFRAELNSVCIIESLFYCKAALKPSVLYKALNKSDDYYHV